MMSFEDFAKLINVALGLIVLLVLFCSFIAHREIGTNKYIGLAAFGVMLVAAVRSLDLFLLSSAISILGIVLVSLGIFSGTKSGA